MFKVNCMQFNQILHYIKFTLRCILLNHKFLFAKDGQCHPSKGSNKGPIASDTQVSSMLHRRHVCSVHLRRTSYAVLIIPAYRTHVVKHLVAENRHCEMHNRCMMYGSPVQALKHFWHHKKPLHMSYTVENYLSLTNSAAGQCTVCT